MEMQGEKKAANTWFLHADLDAFFASVEQLDHPEFRGKPVIVGGLPEDPRSVVSTASYEARKYGVHSAMSTKLAYKLCPDGIYVRGNYKRYSELSKQIMDIFKDYSPFVNQMSIDEAFIDLTGTEKLFGPPEDTAFKIKKRVKEETGLTVSCGLARDKYYAKIASGLSKPDGFYFVKPGTEQDFMLKLPLKDVWGIGDKTQTVLKNHRLFTTKDIFEKPLDYLTYITGNSTANFLYNILRGNAEGTFTSKVNTHSMSEETTFPQDLTNTEIIKNCLLTLCQSVYFRLLFEKQKSRTVVIKIRYENFETVSMRTTLYACVATLDQFFETACELFDAKYEKGRGVRLLGIGFDNVVSENENIEEQQSLFEDDSKKKKAVEKAILGLSQKHPGIKIQKARTLIKRPCFTFFALLWALMLSFSPALYAKENTSIQTLPGTLTTEDLPDPTEEASDHLFDIDTGNENVNLSFEGYWKGLLESETLAAISSKNGTGFNPGFPIFKQEVDLGLNLSIYDRWFTNAAFSDEFKKNTLSMGYKNGDFFKLVMLSNRNIGFSKDYSHELTGLTYAGGNNQAPGFTMRGQSSKFYTDFMVRFDMVSQKQVTYYGNTRHTQTQMEFSDYEEGRFFTLPDQDSFFNIKDIYIERKNGEYKDDKGTRYERLGLGKYSVDPFQNFIAFTSDQRTRRNEDGNIIDENGLVTSSKNQILVTFTTFPSQEAMSSFISEVQLYLGTAFSLSDFITTISGEKALIIQPSTGLSPFEICSIFSSVKSSQTDFAIQNRTTGKPSSDWNFSKLDYQILENDFLYEDESFFYVTKDSFPNFLNASSRFPYTKDIYSTYDATKQELAILVTTRDTLPFYTASTLASEGSIRVFINDFETRDFTFSPSTGIITFFEGLTISESDKVVITWEEDCAEYNGGMVTIAGGAAYKPVPKLTTDISLSGRFPVDKKASSTSQNTNLYDSAIKYSLFNATGGARFKEENLDAFSLVMYQSKNDFNTFQSTSGINWKNDELRLTFFESPKFNARADLISGNKNSILIEGGAGAKIIGFTTDAKIQASFESKNTINKAQYSLKNEKPLFNVLGLQESFSHTSSFASKNDTFTLGFENLSFPLIFTVSSSSNLENFSIRDNKNLSVQYTAQSKDYGINTEIKASYFGKENLISTEGNFTDHYITTLKNELSNGSNDASLRNVIYQAKIESQILSFSPSLSFETNGNYERPAVALIPDFTDKTQFQVNLPLNLKNNRYSLSWKKTLQSKSKAISGGDYYSDTQNLFSSLGQNSWFFATIPFYDLISQNEKDHVIKNKGTYLSSHYSSLYSASWNRKLAHNAWDIVVPSSISFETERDLAQVFDFSDTYQFRLTTRYNAINLFGKNGTIPFFTWYETDEGLLSFTSALKLPDIKGEKPVYNCSTLLQTSFYTGKNSSIKTAVDFMADTKGNSKTDLGIIWNFPSNGKMTASLVKIFYPRPLKNGELKVNQLFSLTSSFTNAEFFTQDYSLSHKSSALIKKVFSLSMSESAQFTKKETQTILGLKITIEGKVDFN